MSACASRRTCIARPTISTHPSFALGGGVRLVKGAYREPANVAYPKKRDVDDNFLALAKLMIGPDARAAGLRAVFGTHDPRLITAIQDHMDATRPAARIS